MKLLFSAKILVIAAILFSTEFSYCQCQFYNIGTEMNNVSIDSNGNCIVDMNLGFEIHVNNGNKIIFLHVWRTQDYYVSFTYSNQNQPLESNILGNALATIIINNEVVNNNPSAPANQVFMSTYGPDPGIDDTIGPARHQVKDASDGLTYNRVTVSGSPDTYYYTINNLTFVLPGACANQIHFTGDAWSSNSNSSNPPVQCSIQGFTFVMNDPTVSTTFNCSPSNISNNYSYTVATNTNQQLSFYSDVYIDNGDSFFNASLDSLIVSNSGPHLITAGSTYSSGVQTYPSEALPQKTEDLWIVVKDITLTNNSTNPPTVTTFPNSLIKRIDNTCSTVLPTKLISFSGERIGERILFNWKVIQSPDIIGYILERKEGNYTWEEVLSMNVIQNFNDVLTYNAEDINPYTSSSIYRLKTLYKDNGLEYSNNILISGYTHGFFCSVSPNPTMDGKISIKLGLAQKDNVVIQLYDLQGRIVQSLKVQNSGDYHFYDLHPNIYIVKIKGDNGNIDYWNKIVVLYR